MTRPTKKRLQEIREHAGKRHGWPQELLAELAALEKENNFLESQYETHAQAQRQDSIDRGIQWAMAKYFRHALEEVGAGGVPYESADGKIKSRDVHEFARLVLQAMETKP